VKQVIAHVDMDCFFAACEEKYDPTLKGKPVMIGALPSDIRGVLATANYEARKFGVHSAMPVSIAYRKCPTGVFLRPTFRRYKEESEKVMSVLREHSSLLVQVSVDEAYLDISYECMTDSPRDVAHEIRKKVLEATGLSCSIGVAESKYVAKIASDFKKPGGVTVVDNMQSFLAPLSTRKMPGIGKVSHRNLQERGINTLGDLAQCDTFFLIEHLGKWAAHFQRIALGNDFTGIEIRRGIQKSTSRERTFQTDRQVEECEKLIPSLASTLIDDLNGKCFRTVSIKVRFSDFSTFTRDLSLHIPRNDAPTIERTALHLLEKMKIEEEIRLFGIRLSTLSKETYIQKIIPDYLVVDLSS